VVSLAALWLVEGIYYIREQNGNLLWLCVLAAIRQLIEGKLHRVNGLSSYYLLQAPALEHIYPCFHPQQNILLQNIANDLKTVHLNISDYRAAFNFSN